jgi:hypothetical protein
MNIRVVSLVVWIAFLLGVGLLDLQLYFAPIGTFSVVVLMGVVFFYRHIIDAYVLKVSVRRDFVVVGLCMLAVNLTVGGALNSVADRRARILVSEVESYNQKRGEFPKSLSVIEDDATRDVLKGNRLIFGSRFAYESDGKTFHMSYNRYPIGDWMWSQTEERFKPALD